jgi:hypothetical protein
MHWGGENAHNDMVGIPESKTPLGRLKRRWGDNNRKRGSKCGLHSSGSGNGPGIEPFGTIKAGEFLD